jgi:hypothetical protein
MGKKKKIQTVKNRDLNILLAAKREINLGTKTIDSKKKYSRKTKHKKGI